ncbi:MAG: MucR family transcriptional regulator [Syntrophobacteraceae bacterium]
MPKKLIEITSEIVQAQVSLTPMTPIQGGPQEEKPALTPENSIQNDKVICLECGAEFKQLTQKHLSSHGMSPKEYKKKYGFTMSTSLSAKSLTKARIKAAKKKGLPEKLKQYLEARRQQKAKASTQAAPETVTASIPMAAEAIQEGLREEKPSLTPENSIQDDKVICLECGAEMMLLTLKHLVTHGMSQKEYKKKYGFTMQTPLAAKSLTKARIEAAKKRGLPENLRKAMEARRQEKAQASTEAATETMTPSEPKRTRLRKKKA